MKTDIIINYDELTKDKVVNILIIKVPSTKFQISLVETLMSIVNLFSPVKFNLVLEQK